MEQTEDIYQPQFPSLSSCVIIDARHGSRTDLLRDIKSGNLFENIIEAKSLDNGLKITRNHEIDACFTGPSVSPEKAAAFIEQANSAAYSKDCAFLALSHVEADCSALENTVCHQIIRVPCSKMKFAEQVIRGVIKANAGSPWAGILLNAERNNINLFAEPGTVEQKKAQTYISSNQLSSKSNKESRTTLSSVLNQASPEMKQMLNSIESGEFNVDENGKPNKKAAAAIAGLVDGILAGGEISDKSEKFRKFFEAALVQWFMDLKLYGHRDATSELRIRLTSYTD